MFRHLDSPQSSELGTSWLSLRHQRQPESPIIAAARVLVAAMQAGGGAAELADALDRGLTRRTSIRQLALDLIARQRQAMMCGFTGDAEIGTCGAPFTTMRLDATTTGTMVSDEVRQLVLQRTIHLAFKLTQPRV